MRVAIIGAGTAGLCAAKHAIQNGMDVTVFEQGKEIGGTWVYTDQIGKNEYGIDVHSSMYRGLHTNLPKEIMGYPDFPIPDQEKSYIPAEDILKFLRSYSDTFKVTERILFQHHVIRVRPIRVGLNYEWEVIVKDLPNDKVQTHSFEYILICNGHYHTPAFPDYAGTENYKGKQLHSHDYRCPDPFKGETVLVIGAGPSGMDLAYEISKKAKRVTLSHHMKNKPKTVFPSNVTLKPDVVKILEDGAEYEDGTRETFSLIFYCTGYKYAFPFLSVDSGISIEENHVYPLWKHCININYPSMAFIGLPFYVCACQMIDIQVRFAIKYFSRKKPLPSKEEMRADTEREMQERWEKGLKKRQAHMMGPDQVKYYDDLSSTAEIENIKPVMTKLHNASSQRFLDDLVNFRKDKFKVIDDETFIKVN